MYHEAQFISLLSDYTGKSNKCKSTTQLELIPDTRNSARQAESIRILWAKNSGM
jgi:hypothetical protein